MATVPADFAFPLPGTSAIPAGFARVESLDGRFPKGAAAGADPGGQGGADTHLHGGSHNHTVSAHTHAGGASVMGLTAGPGVVDGSVFQDSIASGQHRHSVPTSGSITATLSAPSGAVWATANNDPTFTTVRWVRSLGTASGIPPAAWTYWDAAAPPSGWTAQGQGQYLKGAATGANGGTTGGSLSAHLHAGAAHGHPFGNHQHGGGASGTPSATTSGNIVGSPPAAAAPDNHTHPITWSPSPSTTLSGLTTSASTGSQAAEPPYVKLGIIQNDNAGASLPIGIIGVFLGLRSALPLSLILCDGSASTQDTRGKYVKGATISGGNFTDIGGTGGALTHGHSAPAAHNHSAVHAHNFTVGPGTVFISKRGGVSSLIGITYQHQHTGAAGGTGGGTSSNDVQVVDNANHEPANTEVLWVKYIGQVDVTITAPTADAVISAPPVAVAWTLASGTQVSRRVRLYASDLATLLHDSGVIVDATLGYTIPNTVQLTNLRDYYARVSVTNDAGFPGEQIVHFTTDWTLPVTLGGLSGSPVGGV